METLMLQGNRPPAISAEEARAKIEIIESVRHRLYDA